MIITGTIGLFTGRSVYKNIDSHCKVIVLRQATNTANLRPDFQNTKIRSFFLCKNCAQNKGEKECDNFQTVDIYGVQIMPLKSIKIWVLIISNK